MSKDDPKRGVYGLHLDAIRHRRTPTPRRMPAKTRVKTQPQIDVQTGAPTSQMQDGTPIQPIVIQVPHAREPSGPKYQGGKGPELWVLVAAILLAMILSTSTSVYVVSQFLDEYSGRIDRLDTKIEELDRKVREQDKTVTRIEAQVGNLNERERERGY